MRFEYATAARILFGPGTLREVPLLAPSLGRQALFVTGHAVERAAPLLAQLTAQGVEITPFQVAGEPTIELVLTGVQRAREAECDLIIAMGGGSVVDAGRAVAALLANEGEPLDYLEVVGRGKPLTRPSAPLIAIPTTTGTGSEVTRPAHNAGPWAMPSSDRRPIA